MKTTLFILIFFLLSSYSLSAQIITRIGTGPINSEHYFSRKLLNDTLKLENPVEENKLQSRKFNHELPMQKRDLTGSYDLSTPHTQDNMPVARLGIESKMPVLRPDPSVHYFIQTKKIGE
jgi:hypothetical protein